MEVRKLRGVLLVALFLGASLAQAQAPPVYVPRQDSTVLARVPRAYAAWREADSRIDTPAALESVLAEIAKGGDARLVGRLQIQLDRFPADTPRLEVALARIWIAQHQHDFVAARRELDALIVRQPRFASAIAMRAHLNLTQGRLNDGQRDCAAMLLLDQRQASLCAARLAQRRGNLDAADRLLTRLREGADPIARDARLLAAEVATLRGDTQAETLFLAALAAAPGDVRPQIAYARWLRRHGRAVEALSLLPKDPAHDGLALERVLAAAASGARDADALRARLVSKHAAARLAGASPELRDEAELALIAGDARLALRLALTNFETQRDIEDVDLLERAGRAAGGASAAQALLAWRSREGVEPPAARLPAK
ncbi:MAG: hypothetical protein ABIP49_08955 [Lysobacterales bacterium]